MMCNKVLFPDPLGPIKARNSPDGISIELLQRGEALPVQEPWASMGNVGSW